jgi:iron complex transport system substrate-binding protein
MRWLAALLTVAGTVHAQGIAITDDRGRSVRFEKSPQRIVSVLPSLTESVCVLGACDRLVGVDRYSDWPARVQSLPKVGGGLDPSVEAIVALKPDVVLVAGSARELARLESLGLKVLAIEPKTHADVQRSLETLGKLLGTPDSGRVWREIQAASLAAAQSIPQRSRGQRVYVEVASTPYAASESSFIGETLTLLSVRNIVPAKLGAFPQINPEFVVRESPDVIVVSAAEAQALARRPGWASIKAVKNQRVCASTPDEANTLARPGPRMAEAARWLAACISKGH